MARMVSRTIAPLTPEKTITFCREVVPTETLRASLYCVDPFAHCALYFLELLAVRTFRASRHLAWRRSGSVHACAGVRADGDGRPCAGVDGSAALVQAEEPVRGDCMGAADALDYLSTRQCTSRLVPRPGIEFNADGLCHFAQGTCPA